MHPHLQWNWVLLYICTVLQPVSHDPICEGVVDMILVNPSWPPTLSHHDITYSYMLAFLWVSSSAVSSLRHNTVENIISSMITVRPFNLYYAATHFLFAFLYFCKNYNEDVLPITKIRNAPYIYSCILLESV